MGLATGAWKVCAGHFNLPELIIKVSVQLPEALKGSKIVVLNQQCLKWYTKATEEATSLAADVGLETAAVSADIWKSILKCICAMLGASGFSSQRRRNPWWNCHWWKAIILNMHFWEKVMCDETQFSENTSLRFQHGPLI